MEQLDIQTLVQLPFERGNESLLEMSSRKDLRVLVPGSIENPAASRTTHATHALEARREEMQLQVQRMATHGVLSPRVELLEPRVVRVYALQCMLQPEARGECSREGALPGTDHSRDADQHRSGD